MRSAEPTIFGSTARGTSKSASISSSQSRVSRLMSSVRDALVTSVTCVGDPDAASPESFHTR